MGQAGREFRERLHESWRADSREREEQVVRSVLTHFRRRLTGPEAEHLDRKLPEDLTRLWAEPGLEQRREGERPLERTDFDQFLAAVRDDTGLAEDEAENAVVAVFHALGDFLPDEELEHIANILPGGLKERWIGETGAPKPSQKGAVGTRASAPRYTARRPGGGATARRSASSRGSRSWSK